MKTFLLIVNYCLIGIHSVFAQGDPPPPPPPGNHGEVTNQNGAPIHQGMPFLLALGLFYGIFKLKENPKESLEQ